MATITADGRYSGYHRLLSATVLSNLGDGIRLAAFPLLAASVTKSAVLIGAVTAVAELPWLVFGLAAGLIADRADRRRLVASADAVRVAFLGVLVGAVLLHHVSLAVLYAVALACGIGQTLRETAGTSLVPALVPAADLDRANGRLVTAEIAGNELLGPPVGSWLFGVAIALPFAVNGAMLAVAAVLILSLPAVFQPLPAHDAPHGGAADKPRIREGIAFLIRHRRLRAMAVMGAVFAFVDAAWFPILVVYVEHVLHMPATIYGILVTVGALGGLAGGFMAARLARRFGSTTVLLGAIGAATAAQLLLGLTAQAVPAGIALAVSSCGFALWRVVSMTTRQTLTPDALQGRVMSAYRTLLTGATPLGVLAGGLVAGAFGVRAPILLGVPVLVATAVAGAFALRQPPSAC